MKIVSDTGPIIGLAKIGKVGPESKEIDRALNDFLRITDVPSIKQTIKNAIADLGEGEGQAISLAFAHKKDDLLLLDDRSGRQVAAKLNIPATGLVGLLLLAKEKGLIEKVGSLIEELRDNGYWLSDDVIIVTKKLAGE